MNKEDKYIYIWGLFACIRTAEFFLNEIMQVAQRREKQRVGQLYDFLKKWQRGGAGHNARQAYKEATDDIDEIGTCIMETICHASAIPREEIDWFVGEVGKLQHAATNRLRMRKAKEGKQDV